MNNALLKLLFFFLMLVNFGSGGYTQSEFEETLRRAEQGESLAQWRLGVMYYNGEGVSPDYQESAKWFQLAADQGNAAAQYNLGLL